jgi:hypothetical protein
MAHEIESTRSSPRAAIVWAVLVGIVATIAAFFSFYGQALVTAPPEIPAAVVPATGPVYTLELPHDSAELPPGPHREMAAASCTICHSTGLVLNQPAFPREKWAEVVHKMVSAYGAPIPPNEEPEIVDYLASLRGR